MATEPLAASTLGGTQDLLIGRDEQVAAIAARFRAGTQVLTLVGITGVGKSRIALEHAQRTATEDGLRVVMVRISGLVDRALVVDEVLAALPHAPGLAASPVEALWERCHGDDVLLVLDDVEDRLDAGSWVDDLVTGYPGLRVLATGLRPLGARGEVVLRVLPLDPDAPHTPGDISPSVLVFAQKAVAVHAGFSLGPHNQREVLEICRAVGGLPLAIELAASRCAAIPVAVMAKQLSRPGGIGLLRDGGRSRSGRHTSMEQTLEWAYGLLTGEEGELLDQLSVFEGGFDLEAALRVSTPEAADTAQMLDRLSGLIDVHLVDLDPRDADEPRFTLPRVVRSHSLRRLAQSGGESDARARHARYFRSRCRRPLDPAWLPDILTALDRSVIDGDVDDALHAAVAATAQASGKGATAVLHHRINNLVTQFDDGNADPILLARALITSATGRGQDIDGETYAEWTKQRVAAATDAARRSGDQHALLEGLLLTVRSLPTTMDAPSAFAAAAEGLALARELHDDVMTARFELYAGIAAAVRGDLPTTAKLGRAALERARGVEDVVTELHAALLLHRVPLEVLGDDLSLPTLTELFARCEELGETRLGGSVLARLADHALDIGDVEGAARWAYRLQLVAAEWRLTEPLAALVPLVTLVVVAAARGDVREGTLLRASLEKFHSVVTFAFPPASVARYEAASAQLAQQADPGDVALWRHTGAALTPPESHEVGLAYVRSILTPAPGDSAPRPEPRPTSALTPRETQVLVGLAAGATNKEIAATLAISAKTVMHHSVSIYRKLDVRGRGEATAWAFRAGFAPADQ